MVWEDPNKSQIKYNLTCITALMFFQSLHFNYSLDVHKINSVQKFAPPQFMIEQMEIACLYYNLCTK